jgi:hypothetical protein
VVGERGSERGGERRSERRSGEKKREKKGDGKERKAGGDRFRDMENTGGIFP